MEAKSFLRGLSAHLLIVPAWVIPPGLLLGSLALAGAPLGAPGMLATLGTEPAVGLDSLRSYWSGPYERAQEVPTRRVAHSEHLARLPRPCAPSCCCWPRKPVKPAQLAVWLGFSDA